MNVIDPEINPIKANHDIFLKYQKKSIFSIPIATTPAAEPIISILPPVPAEKAMKCQRGLSVGSENIPILAATNGTLSITADPKPSNMITISVFGIVVFNVSAKANNIPNDSRAATARSIPRKNNILGSSILESDL
jgi:hypothetical protein